MVSTASGALPGATNALLQSRTMFAAAVAAVDEAVHSIPVRTQATMKSEVVPPATSGGRYGMLAIRYHSPAH